MALTLMKFELDQAAKDTKNLKFDANFAMEVIFTKSADKGTGPALDESIKASKVTHHSPTSHDFLATRPVSHVLVGLVSRRPKRPRRCISSETLNPKP